MLNMFVEIKWNEELMMERKKKLFLNTYSALIYQVITVVCGFILPQFVIPYFGSATNGLINSITQFLTVITLCECGVGAVVQSSLYKPLADKDDLEMSKVLISSNKFFNNIMKILGIYIIALILIYPILLRNEYKYSYLFIATLILILAFNYIAQYYLFLTYRLLLNADQMAYVQLLVHSFVLILNTILTVILIKLGATVHVVKFGSALVFFIQPIVLKLYVDRKYNINWKLKLTKEPIKQKWNGMAQHIANVVLENTDTVVLTTFSSLENVSIYGVYYLVVHGVRQIIVSFSTGIQSLLGDMFAKKEHDTLNRTFSVIELLFHIGVTLLFTVTAILIIPFIKIYTRNFNDANYVIPIFAFLMVIAQAVYCIRIPYETMIRAAGHYKETQTSSIIEALLNVVLSITLIFVLPNNIKLISVTIGTIMAVTYRTCYLVVYLSKYILKRKMKYFIYNILGDILSIIVMIIVTSLIPKQVNDYVQWVGLALVIGLLCLVICLILNGTIHRKIILQKIKNR